MKKGIFYFFMMTVSLLLFTGCGGGGGNNNNGEKKDHAKEIAGTYPGALKITLQGNVELPEQDNQVVIARNAENKVNLKLNGFTVTIPNPEAKSASPGLRGVPTIDVVIGNINVEGIEVMESGDNVILKEKTVEVDIVKDGANTKANVTVSEGKVSGNTLNMKVTVPIDNSNVGVVFTGTKK